MTTKQQHPCSLCGKELASDNMQDLVLSMREPRNDRRSPRSSVKKYLPPNRWVIKHLYLCHACGEKVLEFLETVEV